MTGILDEGSEWSDYMESFPESGRIDQVREDLFISGFVGALKVAGDPGWHVITVAEELEGKIDNQAYLPLRFIVPWADRPAVIRANRAAFESIKTTYEREKVNGKKVLIHCAAGIERAATAVCYILAGGDPEPEPMRKAFSRLQAVRPEVIWASVLGLSNDMSLPKRSNW